MSLRLIVTGARGFVGSVFALRAAERGHKVLALDDESRGLNSIEVALARLGGTYVQHDCRRGFSEAAIEHGFAREGIDAVAHFAAATGSLERPLDELLELNVEMTRHAYDDALQFGAKTFLWPTTSLALGVPDSPYVESKERALQLLREVDAQAKISVPLRFFNVAGAYKGLSEIRKNEVHLIPELVRLHALGQPLTINGNDYPETVDGTPSRDYVHVLDVADYLLDIAELAACPVPAKDGAIWLGKGVSTTVHQVVRMVEQFTGRPVAVQTGPRRAFDCGQLIVDRKQADQFTRARGGLLTPAWVSVRDELEVLGKWLALRALVR